MPKCKCEHWQICPMCAPHFFDADGKRKPPELTPLQECRAALDALRQAAKEAAEHLRHEAAELKRAHTISGEWDGTELEAMAECKRLIALADRLQANCHDPCGSPWMMEDTGGVRASAGRGRSIL